MNLKTRWEANFLLFELVVSGVLFLAFVGWSELINNRQMLSSISVDSREALYGTFASLFGSLLGFSITAVSIVLGYSTNDKLGIVRQSKRYGDLWNVFKSAIRVLALATAFSLVGLVFDKNIPPSYLLLYLNIFSAILASFRVARCVWVMENIILIVTKN